MQSLTLNRDILIQAQDADPDISLVKAWIHSGERPSFAAIASESHHVKFLWSQFAALQIVHGLAIRKLQRYGLPTRRQVLLPAPLHKTAYQLAHEDRTGGHLGVTKTVASLRQRFLWPCMRRDVQVYVAACNTCAMHKGTTTTSRAPLKPHVVGNPMERVTIDIVGPFPESPRGNKYALVAVDCFTKYLEIFPMPNMEATTVAEALVNGFFTKYGVPMFLHSDQGTQFEAKLFQEMCRLLGIKKTRTTPFRPQSDGQSERSIKTLTKMIATVTREQDDWDTCLPYITMAYRSTPQESTGLTPNLLMFGRETTMPVDVMIGLPPDQPRPETQYAQDLRTQLERAHSIARQHLKQASHRQKTTYDTKVRGPVYKVGDLCWVANKIRKKGISPKLMSKWRGPGIITQIYGDVTAEVQLGAQKFVKVHTDMLKQCHSVERPRWLRRAQSQLKTRQLQEEEARNASPVSVGTQTQVERSEVGTMTDEPASSTSDEPRSLQPATPAAPSGEGRDDQQQGGSQPRVTTPRRESQQQGRSQPPVTTPRGDVQQQGGSQPPANIPGAGSLQQGRHQTPFSTPGGALQPLSGCQPPALVQGGGSLPPPSQPLTSTGSHGIPTKQHAVMSGQRQWFLDLPVPQGPGLNTHKPGGYPVIPSTHQPTAGWTTTTTTAHRLPKVYPRASSQPLSTDTFTRGLPSQLPQGIMTAGAARVYGVPCVCAY